MPRSSSGSHSRDIDAHLSQAHEPFMRLALDQARNALHLGEVPVGAVVVIGREVVATGFNQPIHNLDPTAHAEIVALRRAAKTIGNYRLAGATLYVTAEPCLMCVGSMLQARVSTLVFGVREPKFGAVRSILNVDELRANHHFEIVEGVLEAECRKALQDFFKFKREET
ncbi:MAG: nucleoside deaminase [Vicinamibacteria bacterium]|nr:nucleoside deaminase [Vicinamibacteria bacterium]